MTSNPNIFRDSFDFLKPLTLNCYTGIFKESEFQRISGNEAKTKYNHNYIYTYIT